MATIWTMRAHNDPGYAAISFRNESDAPPPIEQLLAVFRMLCLRAERYGVDMHTGPELSLTSREADPDNDPWPWAPPDPLLRMHPPLTAALRRVLSEGNYLADAVIRSRPPGVGWPLITAWRKAAEAVGDPRTGTD